MNFKKMLRKNEKYTLVTDLDTIKVVREFAEEHKSKGSAVDVLVHGSVLDCYTIITITFVTKEEQALIYSDLVTNFINDYKLVIKRELVFIFKKEES